MTINQTVRLVKQLSVVSGYGLGRGQNSTLRHVQSETGAHPACYPMRTGNSTGGKKPGLEADHSPYSDEDQTA
jgi:hypothetical protein